MIAPLDRTRTVIRAGQRPSPHRQGWEVRTCLKDIEVYLGVDISKESVDIRALDVDGRVLSSKQCVPRTAAAIQAAVRPYNGKALAVLEATGRLGKAPARALEAVGIGVVVENPAKMRHYALSRGLLEKSDRIDASMLAAYGRERRPQPRSSPDEEVEELAQLTARRRQLVEHRKRERTRLRGETLPFNRDSLGRMIESCGREIDEVEQEIRRRLQATPKLWELFERLQSAPGVGETTAAELVAWLPELGRLSRRQAAKLVGVAPLIQQSGLWRGQRRTRGGRAPVRRALYMAALGAVRRDGYFRACYVRLVGREKAKKAALIAIARLLLSVLNQMAKHEKTFDPGMLPVANR